MADRAAIGVFDSGVGGLSVLREIQQLLPHETLLYLADGAHIPYGEKSQAYIRERLVLVAEFFRAQHAKALVLACNTATVAAVADLRERYPAWPIIGMEPAVKPAAAGTRNGKVGVLATTGTLQSAKFAALLDRFAGDVHVFTQPCPGLVEQVEMGDLEGPVTRALLQRYLEPLLSAGCDTLILGCTHYPFLKPLLAQLIPPSISLIDTGAAVARHLRGQLEKVDGLNDGAALPTRFWTSAAPDSLERVLPLLWGEAAGAECFGR